jgi:sugar fermentation stimulation protein A
VKSPAAGSSSPPVLARWPRTEALVKGTLLKRYKRFLADVKTDSGEIVTAHCVNTGAMEGLTRPGIPVWLSRASNPARKLAFTWELAEVEGRMWGVNTSLPNKLVGQLLAEKSLPWLAGWQCIRAEKKYGARSRVDFWLCDDTSGGDAGHYLEVKNCHLLYPDGIAYFPDCKSERATSHLLELGHCASAEVLFVVQVPGARAVRPSDYHDPVFATAARRAQECGVRFSAIGVHHTEQEITVYGPIPVDLEPYSLADHATWQAANCVE